MTTPGLTWMLPTSVVSPARIRWGPLSVTLKPPPEGSIGGDRLTGEGLVRRFGAPSEIAREAVATLYGATAGGAAAEVGGGGPERLKEVSDNMDKAFGLV